MNLQEIEERVAQLDLAEGERLIYSLLRAYGLPQASISRLRSGTRNRSTAPGVTLWKGKVFDRYIDNSIEDLHTLIDDAANDAQIQRERPRFLVVRNAARLLATDTTTKDTLDIGLAELGANAAFFLPWAGVEKQQLETFHYADVKAAERMARLYDEIVRSNDIESIDDLNYLNVFFARLLFCFFAEDTGVFPKSAFTDAVASLTNPSGEDTSLFLDALFAVLNTSDDDRAHIPTHFLRFGHVNGSLFEVTARAPRFTAKGRSILIESGTLNWSQINPDIFGSMMQAVVHHGERQAYGMHYTSVENILKVIGPLFTNSLQTELDDADTVPKLRRFITRLSRVRVFDPACGSGNFLVISYKELRRLEHQALQRIGELDPSSASLFKFSEINLDSFYGIEIDGFAHEVAMLALWIAKHQMNTEFKELFGAEIPLIPLRDAGNIEQGNATELDWENVCPKSEDGALYVIGNPPYAGAKRQSADQKQDFVRFFGTTKYSKNLDYIAMWFISGARYIADGRAELAFVTTNSVSQGDHVGLMWPLIYDQGVEIAFAHEAFRWTNQARGGAGVTVAVIGLSADPPKERSLFVADRQMRAANIGPYLLPTPHNTIVHQRREPPTGCPEMVSGSKPLDGGHLLMTDAERRTALDEDARVGEFIHRYMGGDDFLSGSVRYCLWIADQDAERALGIPWIARRAKDVHAMRVRGGASARAMADRPWCFFYRAHRPGASIIVPETSSEQRVVIPVGFLDDTTVISSTARAIYDAEPWLFALLQSRMHTAWVGTVGGKLETRYRYSAGLCYNTFPVSPLSADDRDRLAGHAFAVLEAREHHSDRTPGDMYLPNKMPADLRRAHDALDETVDGLYGLVRPTDTERLEILFDRYEHMAATEMVPA
jgi:hypothetical protein